MDIMWVGRENCIYPNLSVMTSVQLNLEVSNSESKLIIFGDIALKINSFYWFYCYGDSLAQIWEICMRDKNFQYVMIQLTKNFANISNGYPTLGYPNQEQLFF